MRNLKVLGVIALLWAIAPLRAENLFHHKKEIVVVALHMADAMTTHEILANPCQCFREANPLAPKSGSWGSQIGFHAALSGVAIGGAYWLRHHHSPKLADGLLWTDIAVESGAVTNNAIQSGKQ